MVPLKPWRLIQHHPGLGSHFRDKSVVRCQGGSETHELTCEVWETVSPQASQAFGFEGDGQQKQSRQDMAQPSLSTHLRHVY